MKKMKDFFKQVKPYTLLLMLLCVLLGVGMDASAMTAVTVPTKSDGPTATNLGENGAGPGLYNTKDGVGTTTWDNENASWFLKSTIERKVVKIRPMGTPLETISRYSTRKPTNNMKIEYAQTSTLDDKSKVKVDVAEGEDRINLKTLDDSIFTKKELILFPSHTGYDNLGNPKGMLQAYIVGKDKNGLDIICTNGKEVNGKRVFPALKVDDIILRSARAHNEKDIKTSSYNSVPTKEYNYCQIFRAQVEESTLKKIADKEVDWDLSDQEEEAIFDMKLGMNKAFMFGAKTVFRDEDDQDVYTTEGIYYQTDKVFTYGNKTDNTLNYETLLDINKTVFTGTAGNKTKIWLMGSDLMNAISKIKYPQTFKDAGSTHVKFGVTFKELTTNFGTLWMVLDESFDMSLKSDYGMIFDPTFLRKYILQDMESKDLDFKTSGERNVDARNISEISCLILQNKDAHLRVEPYKA